MRESVGECFRIEVKRDEKVGWLRGTMYCKVSDYEDMKGDVIMAKM